MPATATFELINESSLELTSANVGRKITKGIISGLQVDTDPDPEVLWRAYNAVAAAGYTWNSPLIGHTDLTFQRLVIRGYTTDGCLVWLYHETPFFGGPPSALITRYRGTMSSHTANTFVNAIGQRQPISVAQWVHATDTTIVVKEDYADTTYLAPMDEISVSGLTFGAPSGGAFSIRGYVNLGVWQGKPQGYWLCNAFNTEVARYSGYFTFHHAAISRVTKDWGEIATLRNDKTGHYVTIIPGDVNLIANEPYTNALFKVPGATKVGHYPLAVFSGVFGI